MGRRVRLASEVTERTLDGVLVWPNLGYGRDVTNGWPKEVCLPWRSVNDSGNRFLHTGVDLSVRRSRMYRSASSFSQIQDDQSVLQPAHFTVSRRPKRARSSSQYLRERARGGQPLTGLVFAEPEGERERLNSSSTSRSST